MVVRPLWIGAQAAPATSPTGRAARKFVLLSIVVVQAPSGRLSTVASAPTESAKAINAPPCKTAGTVQRSGRTSISASTRSGVLVITRMPRSSEKGMVGGELIDFALA